MTVFDFILFPFYVLIFHFIFSAKREKIASLPLQKYYMQGFWLRVLGSFSFTIFYTVITSGDSSTLYFPEGKHFYELILKDISNIKWLFTTGRNLSPEILFDPSQSDYLSNEGNYTAVRFVTVLSFFTFGKYLLLNLCFSLIAYSGLWKLYLFFYDQYPHLHKKLAIAIIYFPSIVFWSSGVLKDSLCIGMLGWITHLLYQVFVLKNRPFFNLLKTIVCLVILSVLKAYITLAYLPFFILYILAKNMKRIKSLITKFIICLCILAGSITTFFIITSYFQAFAIDNIVDSVKNQQENFEHMADIAESSFSLGTELDASLSSLVKAAPYAAVATFFRPFLWESKKISTLLSSLEGIAIMLYTLYILFKVNPFRFLSYCITDITIFYCFGFAILFAVFVGLITLNFGSLVRYKIPCMPFYLIALFLIKDKYNHYQISRKMRSIISPNEV